MADPRELAVDPADLALNAAAHLTVVLDPFPARSCKLHHHHVGRIDPVLFEQFS